MRRTVVLSVVMMGLAQNAGAADLDYLRGSSFYEDQPSPVYNWEGFYFGGHGGYSDAEYDFGDTNIGIVAHQLRRTTIEEEAQVSELAGLQTGDSRSASYGAFAGYNWMWEDAMVGIEVDYTRGGKEASASGDIGRAFTTSDNFLYTYNVFSSARARLEDYGSVRARFGYAVDRFMPFATVGVAIGRGSYVNRAGVDLDYVDATPQTQVCDPLTGACSLQPTLRPGGAVSYVDEKSKKDAYTVGVAVGAGIDIAVLPNLFLRAEYQFMQFGSLGDTVVTINTVRGGLAAKF